MSIQIFETIAITDFENNNKCKKILIVTHGGVIYGIHRILRLNVKEIENLEMVTIEI